MDLSNRGNVAPAEHQLQPVSSAKKGTQNKWIKRANTALGGIVVLLLLALVLFVSFNSPRSQGGYVDSNRLQAVFLNTGQVYFGNITSINPQYVVLTNIFYLQTNSSSSSSSTSSSSTPTNVSLVKLGCELHAPYDQMVINMTQVTFWENLQPTGQVAKAVTQYHKEYPNGQQCSDQSSSSGSTTNSVQNAPASNSSSTKTP